MTNEKNCTCGANESKLVMACSGASDVGMLADQAGRMLQVSGKRKMACLAMVGADIEKSIANFKQKDLLVIDGCPTACGKRMMERHGFTNYKHELVSEKGFKKGDSPATSDNINKVFEALKDL
ncbi:MAG: putative zinc-binding protein [Carboxylicivirga sp.]|jgi:uncharacterized metal-binding protein|nr:putative zinc-binding protein [Carboxylicivirga sp.]